MQTGFKPKVKEIRLLMLDRALQPSQVMEQAKISSVTFYRILNGKEVKIATCNKLAKALGVPVTELFTCD